MSVMEGVCFILTLRSTTRGEGTSNHAPKSTSDMERYKTQLGQVWYRNGWQ